MRHLFLPSLLLVSCFARVGAQAARPGAADGARTGFSADRLARIDRALDAAVDSGRMAGAVALVLRDGQVLYQRAVGWSDREAGRRMTPDAIFRVASHSKAITTTAILMLVEEGRIALTDPVSRFIPTFRASTVAVAADTGRTSVPAKRSITIKDLLTHTAGIPYGIQRQVASRYSAAGLGRSAGYGWYLADKTEPICETMERLGTLPLVAQPGEMFVYGYATDVLGCVVERASRLPLDQFIRERITGPLRMKDTHFFLPPEKRPRLTAVYTMDSVGRAARAPDGPLGQGSYVDGPRRSFGGGAGMLSTPQDYARFLRMLANGGTLDGVRVLSPKMVDVMTTNQIGATYGVDGMGFGLGFETVERPGGKGLATVGSWGWGSAYGGTYAVDPAEGLILVFMIQQAPRPEVVLAFPTLVYQALVAPRHSAMARPH